MSQHKSVIGIDLGATNVRAAKVTNGKIIQLESERIKRGNSPDVLVNQMKRLIGNVTDTNVEGIGVGVPSVVDVKKGIVYDVVNIPEWKEVPLKSILEDEFDISTTVNNDANCFALGEKYFGKGKGFNSVVGLILGTGFAAGLVLNGKLYAGRNCGAGEVGMLPYLDSIYEHYCCSQYFDRHHNRDGKEVFEKAEAGDQEALEIFNSFGTHVGKGIQAVMYAYDPEVIVFGGSVRNAYPYFKDSMWESLQDFGFPNNLKSLNIEISEIDNIAILGAAAIALEALGE